ncbi:aldose epimerase family protein [Emticicia fluvialis]|uniref:aldose epimerase family protein n=1 Tax=Emticicia fluvialis TaxID=2974474 RepID=UPI00216569F6|nr:aldose epimerase family protein [Emticicia fluvialis]
METTKSEASITKQEWGQLPDGRKVELYTLRNARGMEIKISDYGGLITHWTAPDKNGNYEDVVLGYDSLSGYLKASPFFGALVGRYGNRIAGAKFTLDGQTYNLLQNNGPNHLHGGKVGFDKVIWKTEELKDGRNGLKLNYVSKDGEEGYPGNLDAEVTYVLTDDNALEITYTATTDKPTVINLTQHSYFNLTGGKTDHLGHEVTINADRFVPVDKTLIPTGELKPVKGTVFDFTKPIAIGKGIDDTTDEQIKLGGGYDHCWVLNQPAKDSLVLAATAYEPGSGRFMEVFTTEPGVQFYTGNFLDGSITGKNGIVYKKRQGFCFETEHFPDSPNQKSFPTVVLRPGETYKTTTIYKFSGK